MPSNANHNQPISTMKVYFAGVDSNLLDTVFNKANVLFSFARLSRNWASTRGHRKVGSIMLDSGAFSAFRAGRRIELSAYCEFLERNLDRIDIYVNLDVIGNAEASMNNLRLMEQRGLSPMPVFHHGEDLDILRRLRDNYLLIGLGGMVPRSRRRMFDWLSVVFEKFPHRYHGFGIGDVSLIQAFPFHSIDNTTWKRIAQTPVLKTRTNTGVNWAERLTRKELFSISRKFYERLCERIEPM